ncbi:chlorophyll a synthase ChlG [Halorhodospira halochloris]|uniref:Chlorophyll a synthase ChlG n=1 Tax=Halorhodospira halochloris TaxID=1052 RepID=A0A120MZM4_HALHR|nr:chlorophyll synthase ChlG [Halorhodospira halochloris]MBK1652849.1 bacteriochlorophyll/chlorophyll a synthase [Halorhodospira halochloris]BAU57328.1 chlorophyll a synthase ChlG [Halorhodospira halochloris]
MSEATHPNKTPTRPDFATVVELLKPVTWLAPTWAFFCGVVSAGVVPSGWQWLMAAAGVMLAGLVCGTSQAINDWFDRHVDAINEPHRPIPSGRMPGKWGLYIAIICSVLALVIAAILGPIVFAAAVVAVALAWVYSAPPFRLKRNGWISAGVVGLSYEGLPWITGAAIMTAAGAIPDWRIFAAALLYSLGAHGIMVLNDFKAVEGDRQMGLKTVPVQLGTSLAAKVACATMIVPQLVVIGLLLSWDQGWHAVGVSVLLGVQMGLMVKLLKDPKGYAAWYSFVGVTPYILGMLITALAIGSIVGGGA